MRKFQSSKSKAIISLALVLSLIFNLIPFNIVSAYAAEKSEKQKTQQVITKEDMNANKYETYYYTDDIEYVYDNQVVEFVSENQIKVGEETLNLKNKKIEVTTKVEGNNVDISFTNLQTPVGAVSGQWNSDFGGDLYISYKSDIPGMENIKSTSRNLKNISLKDLPSGEYHLNSGSIYEAANEWSPGIDGIGTSGNFGTLPNIKIKVNNKENSEKEKVKISIEKRTIGKGDVLSLQSVDFQVNDTAWDVLKRIADENDISIEYTGSGDNIYVSSIESDGEFDHGSGSGWKYQINGEFPDVSLGSYKLKANDEIRLRYCVTVNSEELNKPLVEYLKTVVSKATNTINKGNYTTASKRKVQLAINEANKIIEDEKYNTTNTKEELVVSEHIGNINKAVDSLVKSDGAEQPEDINNVPDDFENDLWLQYDFKEMKVGDKAEIYPRRIPQIVGSSINNDVHRPNFNFEIIEGDSVELSTNDSTDKSIVTAKKEGTTIVKVTYDETVYENKTYGASSKVNTAYVVFTVANEESNMTISTDIKQTSYDTIYFAEGNSTPLDFSVNTTNAKSVKVTCNNEELKEVDGKYRANLKNRSNIIGVVATNEKGETKTYYKVVDARKVEIDIYNKSNPENEIVAGDTVEISFKGISNPVAKLATLYNPTWLSEAFGNKGTFVEYSNDKTGTIKGYCNQWDLATNNTITVKLDEDGTYNFTDGKIFSQWWGSALGEDKKVQSEGKPNLAADTHEKYFSQMPDFSIDVAKKNDGGDSSENEDVKPVDVSEGINAAAKWELANVTNPTYTDEWDILGLVRGDIKVPSDYYKTYYNNLVKVIKEKKGNLSNSKYSEYSRVIIALSALGYDPTDVGGYNLVEKLYNFDNVSKQGINGVIFALIALDTKDFEIKGDLNSREMMINYILENQLSDGGFALSGDTGEVDITAMALQALAKYKDEEKVKVAIEKGLNFLSKSQLSTGGFKAEASLFTNIVKFLTNDKSVEENVESAAQVLVAMNELGIDNTDKRFVKNGKTIVDNIMTFKTEDGGFKHVSSDDKANAMATEQVLYSLVSQQRLENKKTSLYDMSDVTENKPEVPETNEAPVITASDVELKVGDKFDVMSGVSASDKEDGDISKNIKVVKNTVDTSKAGTYKVVYEVKDSKGLKATKEIAVIVKAVVVEPEVKKLKVGIYSDEKPFYESVDVEYKKGDTAYTVLKRLLGDKVISSGKNENLYVESINGLGEFDKGAQSGWVYSVNRSMPQISAGAYELKPGDELIWHYTLNLGKDIENSYKKFDLFINSEQPEVPEQPENPETNEAPVITASDIELKVGDKFDVMSGVSASDKEDGDISKNIKVVKNTVDTSKAGTYKVVYEVKDSKGLKVTKEIKVVVVKEIEIVDVADMIKHASKWELSNVTNPTYTDEWDILGLVRGDIEVPKGYYETYYKNLVKAVKEKDGNLSSRKYTEYSRVIIALSALGYDPTDVSGYNLVEKLYNFDDVSKQGINGVIFALIALDTKDFEIKGDLNSREMMINFILENQLKDGGFALSGDNGEVDITAMALQALAKYKDEEKVKVAIEKALNFLSKTQLGNGGFGSEEGENVESASQVLVAINSLGISAKDERFVKNGKTIVDAINKFEVKGGGYKHLLTDKNANDMATEQVLYALVSQERLNKGKTSLYDMSDVKEDVPSTPENPGTGDNDTDDNTENPGTDDNNTDDNTEKPGTGDNDTDDDTQNPGSENEQDSNTGSVQTSDKSVMPFVYMGILAMAGIMIINRKKLS